MIWRALPLGVLLVACATPEPGPSFASDEEAACFGQAQSGLSDGFTLVKDSLGRWQEVLVRDSFVASSRPSQAMVDCLGDAQIGELPSVDRALALSPAQLEIWDTLSEAQRAEAYERIQDGSAVDAVLASFKT